MTKPPILPVLLSYGWEDRRWGNGAWQKVRCPFHGEDRNPSASLNEDEQVFKCHTCGLGGDAYAVVMEREGVDFVEAKRRVEGITGGSYGQVSGSPGASRRLASSKLPAWTRDRRPGGRRLSSRAGRRDHS